MNLVIISITNSGDKIADKLKYIDSTEPNIFYRNDVKKLGLNKIMEKFFNKSKAIIFIASTGIAVRAIAPYIKAKDKDPAVLVIDSIGKFVISLLSGHLGGANTLTGKVASYIDAIPVITTATDNIGVMSPDIIAKDKGYIIDSLKDAKEIASMLVNNKKVAYLQDCVGINSKNINLPKGYIDSEKEADGAVVVTNKDKLNMKIPYLKLINKNVVLGIGCKKGIPYNFMKDKIVETLKIYNIDIKSINCISTVEIKKHEKAIVNLSKQWDCPLKIFTLDEIKKVQDNYKGSDFVEKTIGVRAVAEPCVELSGATPITEKIKLQGITLCIGILP